MHSHNNFQPFFAFPKKLESKDYNDRILSRESKQRETQTFHDVPP